MTAVIGRGRYARWTYPQSPGAGGGGAAGIVPLSRQKFIDGDTTQLGLNGSVAEPFKTIAQFMTSRTNASVPDATANYVGWVMPAIGGYVENVSFPPYASTELRADSLGLTATAITGNVRWDNVGPAPNTATAADVAMHNVSVIGTVTLTDDANAPASAFIYSGDEIGDEGAEIQGLFDSTETINLSAAIFTNALLIGGVRTLSGTTPTTSAAVIMFHCTCDGDLTAKDLIAEDTVFIVSAITVNNIAEFIGCQFESAAALTAPNGSFFDGTSWVSFTEAGGTRVPAASDTGTTALVEGGYSGGAVEGAALTAATTNVSLNGTGGADANYRGSNSGNHYSTNNGVPTLVTLLVGGGEKVGDTLLITKTDLSANVLTVANGGPGMNTIGKIPTLEQGFVLAQFDGTNWIFAEGGSLPA